MKKNPLIGFIGQGWIGKNYANDFEKRGYAVVRYGLEPENVGNKEKIKNCDIVLIAVPTPTTPKGFDYSILEKALPLVGKGKTAVIKSTLSIGLTAKLQKKYKHCIVVHSPEFLSERTAAYDAAHPDRNIVGIPINSKTYKQAANNVLAVLPKSPFNQICLSTEAEFIKYSHNIHGYIQVVFSNLLFDVSRTFKLDWKVLTQAIKADPMMSHRYLDINDGGRGAGGHCFIKDFEAFIEMYKKNVKDKTGTLALEHIRNKNLDLLISSKKNLDLLEGVYGKSVVRRKKK